MPDHPSGFLGHDEQIVDISECSFSEGFGFPGVAPFFDPFTGAEQVAAFRKELIEPLGFRGDGLLALLEVLDGLVHRGFAFAMEEPQDSGEQEPEEARDGRYDLTYHATEFGLLFNPFFLSFDQLVCVAKHGLKASHLLDEVQVSVAEFHVSKFELFASFGHDSTGNRIRSPHQFGYLALEVLAILWVPSHGSIAVEVLIELGCQLTQLRQSAACGL